MNNSTIKQKRGFCPMCSTMVVRPLIGGLCESHYWYSRRLKSSEKQSRKEIIREPGLSDLIKMADDAFSLYLRLMASDDKGMLCCYICGAPVHYKRAEAMHFVPRGSYFLRWDVRNVKAGEEGCNVYKGGNLAAFAQKLNEERPGLADILLEESGTIYKPSREELKSLIAEYSEKCRKLKKNISI